MANRKELYEKLKELVKEFGEWNINFSDYARKWQLPIRTVHNWKKRIVKELGPVKVEEAGRNLHNVLKRNLEILQEMRTAAKTDRIKLEIISKLNDTAEKFIKITEAYGFKEKIADRLEHSGLEPTPVNFIMYPPDETTKKPKTDKLETGQLPKKQ